MFNDRHYLVEGKRGNLREPRKKNKYTTHREGCEMKVGVDYLGVSRPAHQNWSRHSVLRWRRSRMMTFWCCTARRRTVGRTKKKSQKNQSSCELSFNRLSSQQDTFAGASYAWVKRHYVPRTDCVRMCFTFMSDAAHIELAKVWSKIEVKKNTVRDYSICAHERMMVWCWWWIGDLSFLRAVGEKLISTTLQRIYGELLTMPDGCVAGDDEKIYMRRCLRAREMLTHKVNLEIYIFCAVEIYQNYFTRVELRADISLYCLAAKKKYCRIFWNVWN